MKEHNYIGTSINRKDGHDKVNGNVKYLNDYCNANMLYAAIKTSSHAHASIVSIDTTKAYEAPGVRTILTGQDFPYPLGIYLGDKPPLAVTKVRQYGEPVAAVVANSLDEALHAVALIKVHYDPLKVVSSIREAVKEGAPIIHEGMDNYSHIPGIFPEEGSNIANRTKIRKGNMEEAFAKADCVIEAGFSFPPGDHGAMEVRGAIVEIRGDGQVIITSSTQGPFVVRSLMSRFFDIEPGKITVIAPPVGGGFGAKAGIQLEALTYLLSKAVAGRPVKLVNTRQQDMISSPGRPGFEGEIKLAAKKNGELLGAHMTYYFDTGAYADYTVNISRAAAIACSGPYRIPNLWCESLCIYTNHPFATAYRGFGHMELAFAMERALDILADKLGMDSLELRKLNAIRKGDTTPTQSSMDNNTGDLKSCIDKTANLLRWNEGTRTEMAEGKIRAKGIGCFWKAPAIPTNTDAGAMITFNEDGSINLNCGIVEIGQGTITGLVLILAERMKMSPDKIHVITDINTRLAPHDWTTAASRSLFMAGRAVLAAADDAISQIAKAASIVLRCPEEDLEIGEGRIFLKGNQEKGIPFKDIVLGYVYENGNAIEGQIIGRGRYIARGLTGINPETGEGNPAIEWTLGAEGVEIELDTRDYSYRVLKSVCVMDVGKVIHPALARGQIIGGMAMGLSFASKEAYIFNDREQVVNDDLRSFKLLRYDEMPEYFVELLETSQEDGPFGARGIGEQSIIGIPGALGNALSRALEKPLNKLPLTPEVLWEQAKEENNDSF